MHLFNFDPGHMGCIYWFTNRIFCAFLQETRKTADEFQKARRVFEFLNRIIGNSLYIVYLFQIEFGIDIQFIKKLALVLTEQSSIRLRIHHRRPSTKLWNESDLHSLWTEDFSIQNCCLCPFFIIIKIMKSAILYLECVCLLYDFILKNFPLIYTIDVI